MPWKIEHKCFITQSEPSNYAVMKGTNERGEPVTRVLCPDRNCREEFIIEGQDMFTEAHQQPAGLPPGFVIARSRRS